MKDIIDVVHNVNLANKRCICLMCIKQRGREGNALLQLQDNLPGILNTRPMRIATKKHECKSLLCNLAFMISGTRQRMKRKSIHIAYEVFAIYTKNIFLGEFYDMYM